jgi:mannosyltransferase
MWPWARVSTDEVWLRVPSVLFAVATVLVVYRAGRLIGGARLGALAAVFLAINPTFVRFALEARGHTLAALLVSLAWLGVVTAMRGDDRGWTLFTVAALLAPLAHGLAILHVPFQLALLAVVVDRRTLWRRGSVVVGALALEMAVLFALGAGEVADWIDPLEWGQIRSIGRQLLGRNPGLWLIGPLVVVGVVQAAQRARARDRDGWLGLVPVLWGLGLPLGIVAISAVRPYAEPRYVLSAVPGIALLLAAVVDRFRRDAAVAVVGALVVLALLAGQPTVMDGGVEDWPALADRISTEAGPGDRVLMAAKLRPPLDYAWAQRPRPSIEPMSPTDPLGEVIRNYETLPGSMADRMLADPSTPIWYIDRSDERSEIVTDLIERPDVQRLYRVTGRWDFETDLYLIRLEPRS